MRVAMAMSVRPSLSILMTLILSPDPPLPLDRRRLPHDRLARNVAVGSKRLFKREQII